MPVDDGDDCGDGFDVGLVIGYEPHPEPELSCVTPEACDFLSRNGYKISGFEIIQGSVVAVCDLAYWRLN